MFRSHVHCKRCGATIKLRSFRCARETCVQCRHELPPASILKGLAYLAVLAASTLVFGHLGAWLGRMCSPFFDEPHFVFRLGITGAFDGAGIAG